MHLPFTEADVFWTLTFAALLVLLVVLLGRDRVSRYPFFTAGVVMSAVEMLVRRLLAEKLPPLNAAEVVLTLADLGALLSLLIAVELARRAFAAASSRSWIVGSVTVSALAAGTLAWWGPWPARQTVFAHSLLARLQLMQLFEDRGDLFNYLLFIELALLAIFTGRRFHAGWRSQARRLLLGYSVAGLVQIAMRVIWQRLSTAGPPKSEAEYDHRMVLQTRLLSVNSIVYLAVVIGWIASLWFDDPGLTPAAEPVSPADASPADSGISASGSAAAAGAEESGRAVPTVDDALGSDVEPDAPKPPLAN